MASQRERDLRQGNRTSARPLQGPVFQRGDAPDRAAVGKFADEYDLGKIPALWKDWLDRYGWLYQPEFGWEILGLTPAPSGLDVRSLLAGIRFNFPHFPRDLVPIEWLPERQLACLRLSSAVEDPEVVMVDLDDPTTWNGGGSTAGTFAEYAREFLAHAHDVRRIQQFLANQQLAIRTGKRAADQLPRPDDWRVYRFCSQNVVIAMPLIRFDRDKRALVVGACPITQLTQLDCDAPARAICTLLLSEAYRAGGDLTVTFRKGLGANAETAPIPYPIVRWASRCGLELDQRAGTIDADAAQELFVASGDFSEAMRHRLRQLSATGLAAVCYGAASGTWPASASEAILAWAEDPIAILCGDSNPLQRAKYVSDLLDARSAILLASLITRVSAGAGNGLLDTEDTKQRVDLTVLPDRYALLSAKHIDLVDWWTEGSAPPPISDFYVRVVDCELDQLAGALTASVSAAPEGVVLLCPRDLRSVEDSIVAEVLALARARNIAVLSGPEYTTTLALRAADALSRAGGSRQ